MSNELRQRTSDERGFTLIELLVVILIIGILAAIAIPSFLSQTTKGYDASAKELARTAETTADTYGTDYGNNFTSLSATVLNQYEQTIQTTVSGSNAYLETASGSGTTYVVTTKAYNTNDQFSIVYQNGSISRYCGTSAWVPPTPSSASSFAATVATRGGCVNGSW